MSDEFPFFVRSYRHTDLPACRTLYVDGLIGGKIADNDTALDIHDIDSAYLNSPGCHFWVATDAGNEVVGMIGVQHHDEGVGEIRRLRVRQDSRRRGIGSKLLEAALKFCTDNGYLKITLDTYTEREAAVNLFQKFHFRHHRTREVNGKELLYFYLDIYEGDRPQKG